MVKGLEQRKERQIFDYGFLSKEDSEFLQKAADEIKDLAKALLKVTAENSISIGRWLIQVKERLDYGYWTFWVESEFNWSVDTAERFRNVAVVFGPYYDKDPEIAERIALSAMYILSSRSLPAAAVEEAIDAAKSQGYLSHQEAKKIKGKYKRTAKKQIEQQAPQKSPVLFSEVSQEERKPTSEGEIIDVTPITTEQEIVDIHQPTESNTEEKKTQLTSPKNPWSSLFKKGTSKKLFIYQGDPNDKEFRDCLPDESELWINLPLRWDEINRVQPIKARNCLQYYSQYDFEELDELVEAIDPSEREKEKRELRLGGREIHESLAKLLELSTEQEDLIVVTGLPFPALVLHLVENLGCRCIAVDENLTRVEELIKAWKALGKNRFLTSIEREDLEAIVKTQKIDEENNKGDRFPIS